MFIPSNYALTYGSSDSDNELISFDGALLAAGIGNVNIIRLSSTLSPQAMKTNLPKFTPGMFLGVAYAAMKSEDTGSTIAAAVALARPTNPSFEGVIMEASGLCNKNSCEARALALVRQAMILRNIEQYSVEFASCEHQVRRLGYVIAAVVQF